MPARGAARESPGRGWGSHQRIAAGCAVRAGPGDAGCRASRGPSLLGFLPSLLESVLTVLMVLVLVIFMLIERGALRDRLLTFGGYGHLTLTTKALDEASQRISRYLLMQSLVNGSFGLVFGLGLFVLGVPYALLWGFLAAALRFIPYVGTLIAAVLPIALVSPCSQDGRNPPGQRPVCAAGTRHQLGHRALALRPQYRHLPGGAVGGRPLLDLAVGPGGPPLSDPSDRLPQRARQIRPAVAFLGVVLSDERVEGMNTYYQRLVARDQDEAAAIVDKSLKTQTLVEVYDTVLVPALSYAKQDLARDTLTADEAQGIVQATQEIVEDLGTRPPTPEGSAVLDGGILPHPGKSPHCGVSGA